jgi:poly(hydroxyalkanoate) depolymerase family esterase
VGLIRRLFDTLLRPFRPRPTPGRYVDGSKMALSGQLATVPWMWPSREYRVYMPQGYSRWKRRPLLVLLHGCKQTPEDIATGTRIAAHADRNGWLVLLPRQTEKANAWRCWNWFDAKTVAGDGEAAIVAAQVRTVARRFRAHPKRIFVAGMSAGGSLAAALGVQHSDLFAGVMVHSGLACGAATRVSDAFAVMSKGADPGYVPLALAARARNAGRIVPLLAVQGGRDEVVAAINAVQLVRQFLLLNGRLEKADAGASELPPADALTAPAVDGDAVVQHDYRVGESLVARLVQVAELGHAWSGGDASLPYNEASGPDASALLAQFIVERIREQRRPGLWRR